MAEFEVGGTSYKSGKLNVFQQDKIVRRLAPVVMALPDALKSLKSNPMEGVGLLADAIGKLSDADASLIQTTCLSVVSRQTGNQWAPVMSRSGGGLMFEDIELTEMYTIIFHVLKENLNGFFSVLARKASELAPKEQASSS